MRTVPRSIRPHGFYWVRFEGVVIIAEYTAGDACTEQYDHWHVPGSDKCWKNREVCELLSSRLEVSSLPAAPETIHDSAAPPAPPRPTDAARQIPSDRRQRRGALRE